MTNLAFGQSELFVARAYLRIANGGNSESTRRASVIDGVIIPLVSRHERSYGTWTPVDERFFQKRIISARKERLMRAAPQTRDAPPVRER